MNIYRSDLAVLLGLAALFLSSLVVMLVKALITLFCLLTTSIQLQKFPLGVFFFLDNSIVFTINNLLDFSLKENKQFWIELNNNNI